MSLQDKKLQLLSQDEIDNNDSVEDIFSRYGGDDSPVVSVEKNSSLLQKNDRAEESDPIEDVVSAMNAGVIVEKPDPKNAEQKQWEKELDSAPSTRSSAEDHKGSSQKIESNITPVAPSIKKNHGAEIKNVHGTSPKAKTSYVKRPDAPKRKIDIDPSKKTILIVDDDIDTLEMYADIFENADYNVIRATDGLDALNVISDHTPQLIFTGIVMPRMDGFTMMESLKQNKRTEDIPVVINSHLGRESDRKRAEELGARDFIVRGFTSPREALERIGALLMRSEYVFRFDHNDPEARKLAKDLGAGNFFVCPRGQEMVIKMSVVDPQELLFSARFSCVDEKKK